MPAYFVYVCQEVIDRKELETYWAKIGPTLQAYGAKSLASYTPFEQLEAVQVDGAAVGLHATAERSGVSRQS
jgi:uncharacterized protein (DUF1330 family)